jgi:RND family efflux transporter MFP subunit
MPLTLLRRGARLLPLLILVGLLWGCAKKPAEEEAKPAAPVKVKDAETVKEPGWTDLVGTVQPLPDKVGRITAAVEGRMLPAFRDADIRPPEEGEAVKAGQPIIQLDDTIARANVQKAQANFRDLTQQQAQARVAADLAAIEWKRLSNLFDTATAANEKPLVSPIEVQKARLLLDDALSKEKGACARATAADADLKILEAQLAYFTPSSPIDGQLGQLQVTPGQSVTAGTVIAEVVNLDEVDVLCYVPAALAARLNFGMVAQIVPDAHMKAQLNEMKDRLDRALKEMKDPMEKAQLKEMKDRLDKEAKLIGKVQFIAVQGQPETGQFAVKVRFDNPGGTLLRTNSVVRIQVQTTGEAERLVISAAALMEDTDPPTALVAVDVVTKKNAEGVEEKTAKVLKVKIKVGVRYRDPEKPEESWVEVLGAQEDKEKGAEFVVRRGKNPQGKDERQLVNAKTGKELELFIIEGGHGLKDGDPIKLEAEEPEEEKK